MSFRADLAEIVSVSLPGDEPSRTRAPACTSRCGLYAGPAVCARDSVRRAALAGGTGAEDRGPGRPSGQARAGPAREPERSADNLRKVYSARTLVVTLNTLEEGVMLRGRLVPALPASVIATLADGGRAAASPYKRVSRLLIDMDTVLTGKGEITALVRDEVR